MEKISILIPTYNAESMLEELLIKLYSQSIDKSQKLEIIIVDSSSTDNTVELIKDKFPEVILEIIPNDKFDHGGTRNYLASKAAGSYLLFMTQDAVPYDDYLISNLLKPFKDNKVGISFARQIPKNNANPLEVIARSFNYPEKSLIKSKGSLNSLGIKTFFNSNVCSMYKKEIFYKFNGFPENIILNEDMVLSSKIILGGFKVSYTAEAKVFHSHNYSLKQQFKRYFDIGMAFNQTSYLLEHASNEKEGAKMVKYQIFKLISKKQYRYIFFAITENIIKFIAYNLGKRSRFIPKKIKKKLSAYMK